MKIYLNLFVLLLLCLRAPQPLPRSIQSRRAGQLALEEPEERHQGCWADNPEFSSPTPSHWGHCVNGRRDIFPLQVNSLGAKILFFFQMEIMITVSTGCSCT